MFSSELANAVVMLFIVQRSTFYARWHWQGTHRLMKEHELKVCGGNNEQSYKERRAQAW